MKLHFVFAALLGAFWRHVAAEVVQTGSVCTVTPLGSGDDTPQIKKAFSQCSKDSQIIFQEGTYNIRQVMEFTNLKNVSIDIYGKWVWSADNLQYWIQNTLPVTYASLYTGWKLGGTDIALRGHGKALFDGNGQVWMDENKNGSNRKGRPINLTIWRATNVLVDGITWRQSQFWHTFVAYSKNVTMTNLDMRTRSNSQWSAVNTDGIDTWNSDGVTLRNWTVECYDDCISVKGNSKNIDVRNVTCYESGCAVIGSMGNGNGPDTVDNVLFQDFKCNHSSNAAWIKTYPGQGHVRNVTFRNFEFSDVDQPIYVTSCIYSNSGCDSSRLPIEDITWENIKGTSRYNVAAGMHCSSAAPCKNFTFKNVDIKPRAGGTAKVLCANIRNQADMGLACTGTCPAGWPQQLKGNR
ncbi:glycoside hydrolase family 28 protein [Cercophora newfieldiana]|uniref:galacturonan 1,4-alpha-galacturonidase n=1 Tax=Cercophora newfieldiana TaxID=92897 RepID=A0AA39YLX1_9PEZI|nr:glycoside hydrolase family 28 protein [Cercophora newfieldiana]